MEGHNYSHACHGCHTNIGRLLSSVINRDNGVEISGAHSSQSTLFQAILVGRVAKNGEQRDSSLRRPHHLDALEQATHHQTTTQPVGT